MTYDQAKKKALHYCAYQERSHFEVRNKLFEMGLHSSDVDELLAYLITEGFLNEERFAKQFAGGKFRMKKWGRIKIVRALEAKGLTKNCIQIGLKEIEVEDYENTLRAILQERIEKEKGENSFVMKDKVAQFAIQKGYEPQLVWTYLKSLFPA